jgi:hypothetical protein
MPGLVPGIDVFAEAVAGPARAEAFSGIVELGVVRYQRPDIAAPKFMMQQAPAGQARRSGACDAHGVSLSSAPPALEIEGDFGDIRHPLTAPRPVYETGFLR